MISILKIKFLLLLISSIFVLTVGCSSENQLDAVGGDRKNDYDELSDNKILQGKIIEVRPKGVTLQLIQESKEFADTIRVGVEDEKLLFNLKEEQYILVWYDYIRESNPPQTRGLKIELIGSMNKEAGIDI